MRAYSRKAEPNEACKRCIDIFIVRIPIGDAVSKVQRPPRHVDPQVHAGIGVLAGLTPRPHAFEVKRQERAVPSLRRTARESPGDRKDRSELVVGDFSRHSDVDARSSHT